MLTKTLRKQMEGWWVYVGNNRAVRAFIRRLEQLTYGVRNGRDTHKHA
jgi:hypothetical protein